MSEFLLILIVLVILFGVFRRYIFYAVMGALAKKVFEQASRRQQYPPQTGAQREQPRPSVQQEERHRGKGGGNNYGEYVDFEEVKD